MKFPDNHWLYRLKAEIQKIEPSAQLILYGSRARGEANAHSDWDLLLLTEKEKVSHEVEQTFRMPLVFMEVELGEVLSLQIFNRKEWENIFYITPYFENIQKDGVKI